MGRLMLGSEKPFVLTWGQDPSYLHLPKKALLCVEVLAHKRLESGAGARV